MTRLTAISCFLIGLILFGGLVALGASESAHPEVGKVAWERDFSKALTASKKSEKPVLVLFQEVPGCAGCRQFGQTVLSHPQMVEAIETLFEPVVVYNNQPGKDAEILKQYQEPAWNYQVIRFLDSDGTDIILRKDKIWTVPLLAARMIQALEKQKREVPKYLRALAGNSAVTNPGKAAFAMFCFWTGRASSWWY